MEQKINGIWMNPEGMKTEMLMETHARCLEQLEQTKHDLEVISQIIGERALHEEPSRDQG